MAIAEMKPVYTDVWPQSLERSRDVNCFFNQQPLDVLVTRSALMIVTESEGVGDLSLQLALAPEQQESVRVLPRSLGLTADLDGCSVRIRVRMPQNMYIEIDGLPRMYVFASTPSSRPDPNDENVQFFAAGQVYERDCVAINSGETLYLEYGAVLRAPIRAYAAEGIRIAGAGIIDGCLERRGQARYQHLLRYENCSDIAVSDVTLINPCTWTHVLFGCERACIDNVHQIGHGGGNDGIDVMSSSHIEIKNAFIHSGDDCIVIKAQCEASSKQSLREPDRRLICFGNSEHIEAHHCILMNDGGGNAMEIGHELRCDRVGDIHFHNIDVLGSHGHGAVFSLHNCDRALIEDVLYEKIRVEHHYDKLLSMRITKSRYHFDDVYGNMRRISFRDITIDESVFNPGYTCSVMGGHDPEHMIRDVLFERVRLGDRWLTSFDDFDCYHKHVDGVRFVAGDAL